MISRLVLLGMEFWCVGLYVAVVQHKSQRRLTNDFFVFLATSFFLLMYISSPLRRVTTGLVLSNQVSLPLRPEVPFALQSSPVRSAFRFHEVRGARFLAGLSGRTSVA